MDALTYVRSCLERTPTPLSHIARDSGVGERWLYEFAKGKIPEPGYSKVMLLSDYFMRVGLAPVLSEHPAPQQVAATPRRSQQG